MKLTITIYMFTIWLCGAPSHAVEHDLEALRECGNLHHLEFHSLPNASASFTNSKCMLKCSIGGQTLWQDVLNQGFPCPLNADGICQNGHCIETTNHDQLEAVKECGNMHPHIDFKNGNHTGSVYSNQKCLLRCVLGGSVISSNSMDEGLPCPANSSGICRSGKCVLDSVTTSKPSTIVPTNPPLFNMTKLEEVMVKIASVHFDSRRNAFFASVCLQHSKNKSFDRSNCVKYCATTTIIESVTDAKLNKTCVLPGPFKPDDHLLFNTWVHGSQAAGQVFVTGRFVDSVRELYRGHFSGGNQVGHSYWFRDRFPIQAGADGKHVGEFELEFTFRFAK